MLETSSNSIVPRAEWPCHHWQCWVSRSRLLLRKRRLRRSASGAEKPHKVLQTTCCLFAGAEVSAEGCARLYMTKQLSIQLACYFGTSQAPYGSNPV